MLFDQARFFRAWLANPLRVAALTPSGPPLARLITSEIGVSQAPILELGPGTGVFTQALIDRGIDERDLILVEFDETFVTLLKKRFPRANIVHASAARLSGLRLFSGVKAGAVVSGLGLLSMSTRTVFAILAGAFAGLGPSGAFYQFTYGPRCPIEGPILDRLGLESQRLGGTLCNLPPAAVYRVVRRDPLSV